MANNDDVLKELKSINNRLDGLQGDVKGLKQGQTQTNAAVVRLEQGQVQTNTTLAQFKTTVEAVAAGQKELQDTVATKADIQDLRADLLKKVKKIEHRTENLEETTGTHNPYKN